MIIGGHFYQLKEIFTVDTVWPDFVMTSKNPVMCTYSQSQAKAESPGLFIGRDMKRVVTELTQFAQTADLVQSDFDTNQNNNPKH